LGFLGWLAFSKEHRIYPTPLHRQDVKRIFHNAAGSSGGAPLSDSNTNAKGLPPTSSSAVLFFPQFLAALLLSARRCYGGRSVIVLAIFLLCIYYFAAYVILFYINIIIYHLLLIFYSFNLILNKIVQFVRAGHLRPPPRMMLIS
jgi:hypothetical protein